MIHTNSNITDARLRFMLAGDLLAIRRIHNWVSKDIQYWMKVQANTSYHRIQLQMDAKEMAWTNGA